MKTVYASIERLKQAKPAIGFVENIPEAARLALARFGNLYPVYVNKKTGRILNPVWLEALATQDNPPENVLCVLLELPPQDEKGAAIILNGGIEGLLYNIPGEDIRPYLRDCMEFDRAALLAMLPDPDYWNSFFSDQPQAPAPRLAGLPIEELNIPTLDLSMQASAIPDFTAWNSNSRRRTSPQAYHFYVDDFRFSALAKKPDSLPDNVHTVIEPNFSTHEAQPGAAAIYDIWQKRSMAALWQRRGVRIVVDMNVERRFLKLNLEGVPQGWRAYANRAYVDDFEHLFIAHEFARTHAGTNDILYIVYGGPKSRDLCVKYGWVWLDAGKTLDGVGYGQGNQTKTL